MAKAFDKKELLDRLGGNEQQFKKFVDMFLDLMPGEIENLKAVLDGDDLEQIRQQAHKIKGSCAVISAYALRDTALGIENAAKEDDLQKAKSLFEKLESEFSDFCATVNEN